MKQQKNRTVHSDENVASKITMQHYLTLFEQIETENFAAVHCR